MRLPNKVRAIVHIIVGRPLAYRLEAKSMELHLIDNTLLLECHLYKESLEAKEIRGES